MRAIVMRTTGSPDVLQLEDVPVPSPGEGQVLVRTEAVGASYTETFLWSGAFAFPGGLPAVFGFEAAGTVVQAGDSGLVGRRVTVLDTSGGTYAEYCAPPVSAISLIPDGLSSVDALAVGGMGATALAIVGEADLVAGETVLIESAAGQVGGYLAQLARRAGAGRIIGTAGGPAKVELALQRGFDEVVDHREAGWQEKVRGIDVVFESIGGDSARRVLGAMSPGVGRMLSYGALCGEWPRVTASDVEARGLRMVDCARREGWVRKVEGARGLALDLAVKGELVPVVDSAMPLERAAEAHRRFADRDAAGKIILLP
jgi:NADPH:quinone reductase-like Zn-dependent oxidoreductase